MDNQLAVMLTAKGDLEAKLKSARERVKELDAQVKKAHQSGQGVGDDLATEYRQAALAAKKLGDEVNLTNRKVKAMANESTSALSRVGGAITKHQTAIRNTGLVAGAALALLARQSVNAYASVQDAQSALEATFKRSGRSMIKWANANGDAYNLTQSEALLALQRFSGMAQTAGLKGNSLVKFSTDLTKRAADLASYFGGSTQEALDAMTSGLSGQVEPLRRYNIFMSDAALTTEAARLGLRKHGKQLTENQKILARQSLILRLSGAAQGDVTRTADSMANTIKDANQQWGDFQATAGETTAVVAGPVLKFLGGAAKLFQGLPSPIRSTAMGIAALGTVAMITLPRMLAMRASLATIRLNARLAGNEAATAGTKMGLMGRASSGVRTAAGAVSGWWHGRTCNRWSDDSCGLLHAGAGQCAGRQRCPG